MFMEIIPKVALSLSPSLSLSPFPPPPLSLSLSLSFRPLPFFPSLPPSLHAPPSLSLITHHLQANVQSWT